MAAFTYNDGDTVCEGYVALPAGGGPHPAVLIAHNWAGQTQADNDAADRLAAAGYVGIAIDVYGKGVRGELLGDNGHLMGPWMADRAALLRRLLAAVTAAAAHPAVDADRIAIMGYCFGGLCALDVARSGDPRVKGAVSFHGVYAPPNIGPQSKISASVLVLHGWEDPLCPPDATVGLAKELTAAGADWQIHAYGHAYHAFTARGAANKAGGVHYDEKADRRSWQALLNFLGEIL
ncbi:dienelactone hydrolase family protein [Sandarakinorhabdus rubra]|uniref:dienelactone hydrolase family protein n=1 Tax=Sandarakinorhabdus rubra TaxID=2672568 RepID=UPI0013DC0CC9|nr:dienelactone hydrolase family protein [Sandarakinorhabdus rubra]